MQAPVRRRIAAFLLFGVLGAGLLGCGAHNKLRHYTFDGATMAVIAAPTPRPLIFTGYDEAWVDVRNPMRSALRVGTRLAKQKEIEEAQQRLDSAFQYVDVAERMAARALVRSAPYLGYERVGDPAAADFIMDVRLYEYGILADSWDSSASFFVEGELLIVDARRKKLVWKQKIHERALITGSMLGAIAGPTAGNVVTARALSRLSVDEMATGLGHVADHASDTISRTLQDDYLRARR